MEQITTKDQAEQIFSQAGFGLSDRQIRQLEDGCWELTSASGQVRVALMTKYGDILGR